MNFEEWLSQHSDMPEIGDYEIVKDAWNQCAEEAAKVAEEGDINRWSETMSDAREDIANLIRNLKTQE